MYYVRNGEERTENLGKLIINIQFKPLKFNYNITHTIQNLHTSGSEFGLTFNEIMYLNNCQPLNYIFQENDEQRFHKSTV